MLPHLRRLSFICDRREVSKPEMVSCCQTPALPAVAPEVDRREHIGFTQKLVQTALWTAVQPSTSVASRHRKTVSCQCPARLRHSPACVEMMWHQVWRPRRQLRPLLFSMVKAAFPRRAFRPSTNDALASTRWHNTTTVVEEECRTRIRRRPSPRLTGAECSSAQGRHLSASRNGSSAVR